MEPSNFNRIQPCSSLYVPKALSFRRTVLLIQFILALPLVRCETGPIADQCMLVNTYYRNLQTSGVRDGTPFKSNICPGSGTLGYLEGAATAVTVTIGVELKLDFKDVWQAGVNFRASYTTSKSSAGTSTMTCPPGPWHCALMVIPKIHVISGEMRRQPIQSKCGEGTWHYFQLSAPDVDPHNVATLGIDMCACRNMPGWASPGHPKICIWDC